MRGRIIHYNGNDGKGLIAANDKQYAFDISRWRSAQAPAINQTVELIFEDDHLATVARVPDEVLLKEKAGALAGRLGTAGGVALETLRDRSPGSGSASGRGIELLGKPLIAAQVVFAFSAIFLSFVKLENPLIGGSQGFSLTSLADLSQRLGSSVGGGALAWLAIVSIALPVFWHKRWAWLALLLPLLATLKPVWDVYAAVSHTAGQMRAFDAGIANAMLKQFLDMLGIGSGAWLCLLSALLIALIGVKRALLPASAPPVQEAA
jgi:hypothetical protein